MRALPRTLRSPSARLLLSPALSPPLPPGPPRLPHCCPRAFASRPAPTARARGFDPEEMPDYDDEDDANIPFAPAPPAPRAAAPAPAQAPALPSTDPWAFLQGIPHKLPTHQVPIFRAIPPTGPPPAKYPLQRALREPDRMNSSTLTEREREIFTRIFETILSEKSTFQPRTVPTTFFPSTSLNALFESAVGPQQSGSEISFGPKDSIDKDSAAASLAMASALEEYPAALRLAAAKAAGLVRPNRTAVERKALVMGLNGYIKHMQLCNSDLALAQWMDEQVFPLADKGKAAGLPLGSYAYLLAEGMKQLRTAFNDIAGVIAVFERIKKLGAESYVLGCSVEVYNQVIAAKWEGYRDLYKVKELVDEMEINGIQGDKKTLEVLKDIMDDISNINRQLQSNSAAHAFFTEGHQNLLEHLNYKTDTWKMTQDDDDGSMTESLEDLSG